MTMATADQLFDQLETQIRSLPDDRRNMIMGKLEGAKTFTVQEVADLLNYSDTHIRRLLRKGDLAGVQTGRGWRISRADLEEWWTEQGGNQLFDGDVDTNGDAEADTTDATDKSDEEGTDG
jgi:excisionase family DNA binding protein